jgi:uncharacterized protein YqcC (DUF446 family)
MSPAHEIVQQKIDEITSEMKRIGIWRSDELPPEKLQIEKAFGADKMSFAQWLQFIFVPRVSQIIREKDEFPAESHVHDQAFKEWRMWGDLPDSDRLLELLKEFDTLFTSHS